MAPESSPTAVEVIPVETARALLRLLDPLDQAFGQAAVYRGHARSDWRLIPSLLRPLAEGEAEGVWDPAIDTWGRESLQDEYLQEFVTAADEQGVALDSTAGKDTALAVAQHYGVPTNLIDWTLNPYTAAYFAAEGNVGEKPDAYSRAPDMAVWIVDRSEPGMEPVYVSREHWGYEGVAERDFSCRVSLLFPEIRVSQNPNMRAQKGLLMQTSVEVRRLWTQKRTDLVAGRGPGFDPERATTWEVRLPLSVDGLIETILPSMKEEDLVRLSGPAFRKVTLPGSQVPELLTLLDRLGINGSSVYPGLYGAARRARERIGRRAYGYPAVYGTTY